MEIKFLIGISPSGGLASSGLASSGLASSGLASSGLASSFVNELALGYDNAMIIDINDTRKQSLSL
jgi:hypothetical protein